MYQGTLPAVSNRADWQEIVLLYVAETGEPFDATGAQVVVQLSRCPPGWNGRDYGFSGASGWALAATTENGRATAGPEGFTFHFTRDDMTGLCPDTYVIGATLTRSDFTTQILLGTVPVLGGGVPK